MDESLTMVGALQEFQRDHRGIQDLNILAICQKCDVDEVAKSLSHVRDLHPNGVVQENPIFELFPDQQEVLDFTARGKP